MKKLLVLATAATLSFSAFAYTEAFSTTELKAMDCADLAVEQANAKRELTTADTAIANLNSNANAPAKTVSKWAGLAGGALSAFAGNSQTTAKAAQIANSLADDGYDDANLEYQQAIKVKAQTNIDNIAIYQKSKKCKI